MQFSSKFGRRCLYINAREYRSDNKKRTPQKKWQQGTQCEEKENRNTTQYVLDITKRKQTQIM